MIELERLLSAPRTAEGFRLYAERLQIWRLCPRAKCRRGRACEDAAACGGRLADWAEAVKDAARRDPTYDPEADAIRLDLVKRLETLARSTPEHDKEGVS
jgi:hypothetical protein